MSEPELNQQNDFMIEKIKERPVNKKKLLRRTIITASMAVIFGLIACFTFLVLEPVINNWLYPEEEPKIVVFPEDQEEMSPEEMLSNNMQLENESGQTTEPVENPASPMEPVENPALPMEQIQEILSTLVLGKEHYKQIYYAMSSYVEELNQYMVTVTGVTANIDWFNNVEEKKNQSYGVIIANNGKELFIMADYTPLASAENLTLTFYNNAQVKAQLKKLDSTTNLAVLSVELEQLSKEMYVESLKIATLGSSGGKGIVGTPVVALGNPTGISGSVGYGMVTAVSSRQPAADTNYKFLHTDIMGTQTSGGVLFNLNGQVIGIITNNTGSQDTGNMITAYGITELRKRAEKMSNGEKMAYLGISGVDVTREANTDLNVPYGVFVTEVEMDSPSMLAGIQQGDVLVAIDDNNLFSYGEYITMLMQMEPGQSVKVTVMRQSQEEYKQMKFEIVLGEAD